MFYEFTVKFSIEVDKIIILYFNEKLTLIT